MNIKFRAWDKEKQRMLPVTLMNYNEWWVSCEPVLEDKVNSGEYGERNSFSNEKTDRHILMQYIGITDDNGIEIYDKDIIEFYEENMLLKGEVEWLQEGCRFVVRVSNEEGQYYLGLSGSEKLKCNIIGNTYENKSLLGI